MPQTGPDTRYMAVNEFRREVLILKSCRDPNIVAFLVRPRLACWWGRLCRAAGLGWGARLGTGVRACKRAALRRAVLTPRRACAARAACLQGACMHEERSMLVTEYCEGGNLARNIVAGKVNWYRRGRKVRARCRA